MLECQRIRIHERSRLRAEGFTESQIREAEAAHRQPFRPAFENGRRRPREHGPDAGFPASMTSSRQGR